MTVPTPEDKPQFGFLNISLPEDFFDPMTEEELAEWEGPIIP